MEDYNKQLNIISTVDSGELSREEGVSVWIRESTS